MSKTENDLNFFSDGLDIFMSSNKLDQKDVAKICGVSYQLVNGWMNGRSLPTYESLRLLYAAGMDRRLMFGVSEKESQIDKELSENLDPANSKPFDPLTAIYGNIDYVMNTKQHSNSEKRKYLLGLVRDVLKVLDFLSNKLLSL